MFDVLQPVACTNSELFLIFFVAALHVSLRNGPISVSSLYSTFTYTCNNVEFFEQE